MRALALAVLLLPAAVRAAPMRVMVLYFENHTALRTYDVLQKGLADMLITDLGQSDQLAIVEREKLEALTHELKLQQSKLFDPATAAKLGKLAGAQYAVTGAFTGLAPEVRIDVRLLEVATGKVLASAQVKGAPEKFFELEQELVAKFLAALAAKARPAADGAATLAHVLGYSQGLDTADRGDAKAAAAQVAAVVRDAPDFQLAKARYAALLKRLREASVQRDTALTGDEAVLAAGLDVEIAKHAGQAMRGDAAELHFCYRALRSAFLGWKLDRSAQGPFGPLKAKVLAPGDAKPLLTAMWENERALASELAKSPNADAAGSCAFAMSKGGDYGLARTLKVPFDEGYPVFHPAVRVPKLVAVAAAGVLPTLFGLDPGLMKEAHALLDAAEALQKTRPAPGRGMEEATLGLAQARAQLFLREGKVEPAVSALQRWLEQNPRAPDYAQVEGMVEDLMGIGARAKTDAEALAGCTASPGQLRRALTHAFETGGPKQASAALAKVGPSCASTAHAAAAWLAAERGDCASAKAFIAKAGDAGDVAALKTVCE